MSDGRRITVKGREIGGGAPIFLTAEIGCSHNGSAEKAKELMRGAKDAGCDGADMFLWHPPEYYWCDEADIYKGGIFAELERLSLRMEEWRELFRYADAIGLVLYVTPLDFVSVEAARELGSPMVNINSDDVNNVLLLERVARLGVPVTMHDINATLGEVEGAVGVLREGGCKDIIVLHSTMESGEEAQLYATANLRVMETYRSAFGGLGVEVGCVEHTTSDFLIYAVAALGPALISKHLLMKHEEGTPDDSISVDLESLSKVVRNVRYVEMALGQGRNCLVTDEQGEMLLWDRSRRKVLVAARDLPAGHKVEAGDIVAKRPGNRGGLHPWLWRQLHGAKTAVAIRRDEVVTLDMFREYPAADYKFPALEKRRFSGRRKGA
ncbi:MAG: N-acetylneuraminate synthase family protein [Planctomycetota bacterium]